MSKAFLKDDGPSELDEEAELEASNKATRGNHYITASGLRALEDELEHLWCVERPKVTREVAAAAAQGDRSENAEYIYGKKRLREIDRRVRFLRKRLEVVVVVTPAKAQEGKVFFGAFVTVEDEDGVRARYRIVGTDEIGPGTEALDPGFTRISVESPLARALLGKAIGDVATVVRPKGTTEVSVVEVSYLAAT
jgi:transcription elongation factor GreB